MKLELKPPSCYHCGHLLEWKDVSCPKCGGATPYEGKNWNNGVTCNCVVVNRNEGESQREWFKRWMCMFHWIQTDYYQNKLSEEVRTFETEKT